MTAECQVDHAEVSRQQLKECIFISKRNGVRHPHIFGADHHPKEDDDNFEDKQEYMRDTRPLVDSGSVVSSVRGATLQTSTCHTAETTG